MKSASSGVRRPSEWRIMLLMAPHTCGTPKNIRITLRITVGRITATSGSRPTMMVSVWWRVWLQRQTVGSRMIMKQATW